MFLVMEYYKFQGEELKERPYCLVMAGEELNTADPRINRPLTYGFQK
jgi:hypothetical protein